MKKIVICILALVIALTFAGCGGSGGGGIKAQSSRTSPAKVNETVTYDSMSEQNDAFKVEITLLEVVRGGAALKMAVQASIYNDMPPDGQEYLFVKFRINALDSKDDAPIDAQYRFGLVRSDGNVYDDAKSFAYISDFDTLKTMYKGTSQEGYVCFNVDMDDKTPLIAFPTYSKSQVWFSAEPTTDSDADADFNPLGDPDRIGTKGNPAALGETVNFNGINVPRSYNTYDVDITVTEINRGQRAMDMVTMANKYNDAPPAGKEYLIAKVKIDANASRGDSAIDISSYDFSLFSSGGTKYTDDVYVYDLENQRLSQMYPGATQEGYLVFAVDQNDENPYIVFGSDTPVPVWISAAESNTEALIDPNALGTKNTPVPLDQAFVCDVNNYNGKYKLEMKIEDYIRGTLTKSEQDELGLRLSDMDPGMEVLIIRVQVKALESEGNASIRMRDYDFELISGTGIKYDRMYAFGNVAELKDMYPGATQEGCVFFAVNQDDENPLILYGDDGDNNGTWFSLQGSPDSIEAVTAQDI